MLRCTRLPVNAGGLRGARLGLPAPAAPAAAPERPPCACLAGWLLPPRATLSTSVRCRSVALTPPLSRHPSPTEWARGNTSGSESEFRAWKAAQPDIARLLWEAKTERLGLSRLAEEFFRRLAARIRSPMLLRKGDLHQLLATADRGRIPAEVTEKLDLLVELFRSSRAEV